MTSTMLDQRRLRRHYKERPMRARIDLPCETEADVQRVHVPSPAPWDPDIERWINEGGALLKRTPIPQEVTRR